MTSICIEVYYQVSEKRKIKDRNKRDDEQVNRKTRERKSFMNFSFFSHNDVYQTQFSIFRSRYE